MRRALLGAAVLGTLLALVYLVEGLGYPRGTPAEPGPGLYPLLVGLLLMAGSLGTGLEARFRRSGETIESPRGAEARRVLSIVGVSLGYVLLLHQVGHPVAGTLVTLAVLQVMGLSRWTLKLGLALALGLGSHYLFAVLLGVPLPTGNWFR